MNVKAIKKIIALILFKTISGGTAENITAKQRNTKTTPKSIKLPARNTATIYAIKMSSFERGSIL